MPHSRQRHLQSLILKRLKLWPVLGVVGARQVGKSTLLRDQISAKIKIDYRTMDRRETRLTAENSPSLFLSETEMDTLVIDEVQKTPDLFDAIKADVDAERRPGRYLISGSTQFSHKVGIRESLTGRISVMHLYPLTLAETRESSFAMPWVTAKPVSRFLIKDVLKRLECGGMPGLCFLRSKDERQDAMEAWLDTTCQRDLYQIMGGKLKGDLARSILNALATLEQPTLADVAAKLRQDARRIRAHLEAMEILLIVNRIDPHPFGYGKAKYFIFDSGIAGYLGATRIRQFACWVINECLAQFGYAGKPLHLQHYLSRNRSGLDLVIEHDKTPCGVIFTEEEGVGTYTLRAARAFLRQAKGNALVIILAPVQSAYSVDKNIRVVPWGGMS